MGRNNRTRRAAKARQRRGRSRARHQSNGQARVHASAFAPLGPGDRFVAAAFALRSGDDAACARIVAALAAERPHEVATEIAEVLENQVAHVWDHGWQPADLARAADRGLAKPGAALVRRVIAAQAIGYASLGDRVAPEWIAQLNRIGALPEQGARRSYLPAAGSPGSAWAETISLAVHVMRLLLSVPSLPRLTVPPSEWREGLTVPSGPLAGRVLEKIRALLAKAESTEFDAEAEALTAKAQELMARHRIDHALLDAAGDRRDQPVGRRIDVDDPYAEAKAALLARIADVNGCHAVWSNDFGFSTVFGFAGELDAVEELFTSLLVQATGALRRAGSKHDRFGRTRTTRFRRSFLVAFAVRIGQRLREAVEATIDEVAGETGTALLPILAARTDAVKEAAAATYPDSDVFAPSVTDGEGWYSGTLFADQADLSVGPKLEQRSA